MGTHPPAPGPTTRVGGRSFSYAAGPRPAWATARSTSRRERPTATIRIPSGDQATHLPRQAAGMTGCVAPATPARAARASASEYRRRAASGFRERGAVIAPFFLLGIDRAPGYLIADCGLE